MNKLQFKILKQQGNARVGEVTINGISFKTPCFMPVWTKATIKWLMLDLMRQPWYLWTTEPVKIILSNTYHLYLRPWEEIIKKAWWLHKFMNREDGLILTDSGWFQVFSLWLGQKTKQGKSLVELLPNGVTFRSIHDGSKHLFTPENVVDIQSSFGSDIMMMLDVCSPVDNITKWEVASQMWTTHHRAKTAFEYFQEKYESTRWVLFPIIQWGLHDDLREESAKTLSAYARDGIAIGGLSVWETKDEMKHVLEATLPHVPTELPRYLMGVGTPEDLIMATRQGVDMFDCVLPTRLWRHGTAFSKYGQIKLSNAKFREDFSSLDESCWCHTCKNYTKAYLHHLCREGEMLGWILLSLHNIAYLHQLCERMRDEIMKA